MTRCTLEVTTLIVGLEMEPCLKQLSNNGDLPNNTEKNSTKNVKLARAYGLPKYISI